jgi:mycothiol synthase
VGGIRIARVLGTDRSLSLRRPALTDAQAIADLINVADDHDYGAHDVTVEDMLEELEGTDLEHDAWLVERGTQLVALAAIQVRAGVRFTTTIYVHPDARRQGIGSDLVDLVEERSAALVEPAPADAQLTIVGWVNGESDEAVDWAQKRGYEPVRNFLRMQVDFDGAPAAPAWPEGIRLRTYREDDARALFDASEEAFSDHWGHLPMAFDEWVRRTKRADFDPSLWFVAMDGDEIAAMSLCSLMPDDGGWVSTLGVRRAWRQRGIARAILLHSLGEFWGRGRRWVALGVDAQSLTGATRLYESVGMRVRERHTQMRKVVREGTEIEVSSLD